MRENNLRVFRYIGLIIIFSGFILNYLVIAYFISSDGVIENTYYKLIISIFDLSLISLGILIYSSRINIKFKLIVFGLLIPFIAIVVIDYTASRVIKKSSSTNLRRDKITVYDSYGYMTQQKFFVSDSLLGYKPRPASMVKHEYILNDKIIHHSLYNIDKYSRRVTPMNKKHNNAKFLIFFGGSIAFGHLLNDNETIPYYTSECLHEYQPYNYAFNGYGPQQMLAKLQSLSFNQEIDGNTGIGLYIFSPDHIKRAIGSMSVFNGWAHAFPHYKIIDDKLVRAGTFYESRKILTPLFRLLGNSFIVNFMGLDFPAIKEKHLYLTFRIIKESYRIFKESYSTSKFIVLFYPEYTTFSDYSYFDKK